MGAIYIFIEQRVGPLRMTHINTSAVQHKMFACCGKKQTLQMFGLSFTDKMDNFEDWKLTLDNIGWIWDGYLSFITVGWATSSEVPQLIQA